MHPSESPSSASRPLWGLLLLTLPLIGVGLTGLAYAIMWGFGLRGRSAAGPTVDLVGAGCPEAYPVLLARLSDMGLPVLAQTPTDPAGRWSVQTTLPADPHVAEQIPHTLAALGRLEIRAGDRIVATNENVRDASVRMDLMMSPRTLLQIDEDAAEQVRAAVRADPNGVLVFWVDGQRVGTMAHTNPVARGELEIDPPLGGRDRWDATAAWSVTLDHPLPCAPALEVRPLSAR